MASLKLNLETEFLTTTCCKFGCVIALTKEIMQARRRDHATFYCPSGHPLSFTGEATEEQLRRRLSDSQTREATAKREAEYQRKRAEEELSKRHEAEGKLRRVKNGVCPCCKRSFSNLGRHMKGKHPDFATPATTETQQGA
jgi:hypothetical protein